MKRKNILMWIFKFAGLALILSLLLAGSSASAKQIHNGPDVAKLDAFYSSQIAAYNLKGRR